MSKYILILISLISINVNALEADYVNKYCKGEVEVVLSDRSRADCIQDGYAMEYDFAHKWAESIGQALLYSKLTGLKPAVVLIRDSKSNKYIDRFLLATDGLGIHLFTVEK